MHGVSPQAVDKWCKAKRVVLVGNQVDVDASNQALALYRDKHDGRAARGDRLKAPSTKAFNQVRQTHSKTLTRGELIECLKALDWTTPFDPKSIHTRLEQAAKCVGFALATSPVEDDGHWGGYQVRSAALLQRHGGLCFDAVIAGHGFELDAFDVLTVCRDQLWHADDTAPDMNDVMDEVHPDLLPALAWPFGGAHQPSD